MNNKQVLRTALTALIALLPLAAAAQAQVYRCGSSYSEKPCPGATTVPIDERRPTAQEAADSRAATRRDARLAGELEKQRLAQEKAAPGAVVIDNAPKPAPAASASGKRGAKKAGKPEQFKAVTPAPPKQRTPKKKRSSD